VPSAKEIATAIALLGGGRVVGAGVSAARQVRAEKAAFQALTRRGQMQAAAVATGRAGRFVGRQAITKNPYGMALFLAHQGYIHRDDIIDVAESIGEGALQVGEAAGRLIREENGTATVTTRKVSKANKAVRHAMGLLKAGPKGSTGAGKGILPKGAFKLATKAAGLANPKTKSVIGKGKGKLKALARKIRKWW